jgi:hypothetical protein
MKEDIVGSVSWAPNPLSMVVLAAIVAIIVDIVRHDVTPKWAWIVAAVLLFPVGPILYLLWGRVRLSREFVS